MNKKLLGLAVAVAFLAMLVAPVMAGKGQEVLDFQLLMQGLPSGGESKQAGGNTINRDVAYDILGDFYVQIGTGGAVETISKDYLEYEGNLDYQMHSKQEFFNINVQEVIYIYADTDKDVLRGTLEIVAIGTNKAGNGGTFAGHGTGEFEGVKIIGTSVGPTPVASGLQLTRTGTVMGWP